MTTEMTTDSDQEERFNDEFSGQYNITYDAMIVFLDEIIGHGRGWDQIEANIGEAEDRYFGSHRWALDAEEALWDYWREDWAEGYRKVVKKRYQTDYVEVERIPEWDPVFSYFDKQYVIREMQHHHTIYGETETGYHVFRDA